MKVSECTRMSHSFPLQIFIIEKEGLEGLRRNPNGHSFPLQIFIIEKEGLEGNLGHSFPLQKN